MAKKIALPEYKTVDPQGVTGTDSPEPGGIKRGMDINILSGAGVSLVFGVDYDDVLYTYPTTTTDQIELKLGVTSIATYEVTYSDSSKCELSRIQKL